MTLELWDLSKPALRRVKRFTFQSDMFLYLLRQLDGLTRIECKGIPHDARVVGLCTSKTYNTVEFYLESSEFPEVDVASGLLPGEFSPEFILHRDAVPA